MTEEEAEQEVCRLFRGDSVEENCGVNNVLGEKVWEIWVKGADRRMATRFLLDDGTSVAKQGFRDSDKLFAHFNEIYKNAVRGAASASDAIKLKEMEFIHDRERLNAQADRSNKRFSMIANTFAALGGFVLCLVAFIYMLLNKESALVPSLVMAASVLATCCTFLFGRFVIIKLEELFGPKSRPDNTPVETV